MKQVPMINTKLKRNPPVPKAEESAGDTAALAVIARQQANG